LNNARESLRDAKNRMGIVSVETHKLVLQGAITAAESDRAQTQASLAASRAKLEMLRGTLATLPERITTDEIVGYPNVAADQMRPRLYDLEIRKAEMAAKYTDVHPHSQAARAALQEAVGIFDKQALQRTQRTTTLNTTRQQLQLALLTEGSNASSLAARMQAVERQLADLDKRVHTLNDQETRIAQLQDQVDLCSADCTHYAKKLEQSSADQLLKSERITNVNLLQPATYVAKPVRPNKQTLLAAGLILAIAASLGIALLAEALDPSVKTASETFAQDASRSRWATDPAGANNRRQGALAMSSGETTGNTQT
jgi:uncharacterized protein involved in exopolysaccharide biosynthesis